jgi:hypothetical protein
MIIKTKNYSQNDNDIYFLDVVYDKIVVNDNYDGIQILDSNLNLIKKIKIFSDITIYTSYTNYTSKEILLYCPDNECIVYIDLKTSDYKVIYLREGLENLVFSSIYSWIGDDIALSTYKGKFYNVSINEKTLKLIDCSDVGKLYPELYEFYQGLSKYKVINVHQNEYVAVIEDEKSNIAALNYKDRTREILKSTTANFIDMEFTEQIFIIVNEEAIKVVTEYSEELLQPNENFIFLKARFLKKLGDVFIVILSSSKSNANHSNIDIFKLCK